MGIASPVIIVGGGAFGLSTALHLSQRGYVNITVIEQDDQIPSRYSAANDINKIMRAEYEDPFYTELAMVCPSYIIFVHLQVETDRCTPIIERFR